MSKGADRVGRHGWNSLQGYFNAHDKRIADFSDEGFIVENNVSRHWRSEGLIVIMGRLRCQHGTFIDVLKYLEVRILPSRAIVRTQRYRYHAGVEGPANRPIFRYDNSDTKTGHADAHHKHRFDPTTWQEIKPPVWIGEESWPHLSDVVEELRKWWETAGMHMGIEVSNPDP
jgi:hypothetical protein